jgi:hypothetical protein
MSSAIVLSFAKTQACSDVRARGIGDRSAAMSAGGRQRSTHRADSPASRDRENSAMATHRRRRTLPEQWLELAWAAPWVIAHRLHRSDERERSRMVTEKVLAAGESWAAMASYALALQRSILREMLRHRSWGSLAAGPSPFAWSTLLRRTERGLAAATSPYRRRASANLGRLYATRGPSPRPGARRRRR